MVTREGRVETKFTAVVERLDERYGRKTWRSHGSPIDELVGTILSQHTSDVNTARAFTALTARFPTWSAARAAPSEEIADAIRSGGLAQMKAPRIKAILAEIEDERDGFDLAFLGELPLDEARGWLTALRGVGPKTAACVLLFSLGRPAMPVDTHVHRLSRRLGLVGPKISADATHGALEALLGGDREDTYSFHLNAIAHGRAVCRARTPRCESCRLTDLCDYYHDASRHPRGDHERPLPAHPASIDHR